MAYSSTLDSSTLEPGSASCSDAAEGSIKESSRSWESPAGFSDFRWTLRSIFSRCLSCRERSFRRLLKLERLRPAMRTSTGNCVAASASSADRDCGLMISGSSGRTQATSGVREAAGHGRGNRRDRRRRSSVGHVGRCCVQSSAWLRSRSTRVRLVPCH